MRNRPESKFGIDLSLMIKTMTSYEYSLAFPHHHDQKSSSAMEVEPLFM